MPAYVVTATGTDVGKSFVMQALIHAFRQMGREVDAFKPVVSGLAEASEVAPSDTDRLLLALGRPCTDFHRAACSAWSYAAPLSPDRAAAREGKNLALDPVVGWCEAKKMAAPWVFFEGAGGVMSPLSSAHTQRDWMAALRLPVILVMGNYLGCITHLLTAWEALAARAISVAALVVNDVMQGPLDLEETVATLRPHLPVSLPIFSQPHVASPVEAQSIFQLARVVL